MKLFRFFFNAILTHSVRRTEREAAHATRRAIPADARRTPPRAPTPAPSAPAWPKNGQYSADATIY